VTPAPENAAPSRPIRDTHDSHLIPARLTG